MATKRPKSNAKSNAKSKRGGTRRNAGRKPSEAKALRSVIERSPVESADAIERAETVLRERLGRCFQNLFTLADGGYRRDKITREPAGLVMTKRVLMRTVMHHREDDSGRLVTEALRDADGNLVTEPMTDDKGRPIVVEEPLFPHLPPDELVVVSHASEVAEPDRAANEYLINCLRGKPHTAEAPLKGEALSALPSILEKALERAYGTPPESEPATVPAIEV